MSDPAMPDAPSDMAALRGQSDMAALRADLAALRAEIGALRRETAETAQVTDGLSLLVTLLAGQMQRMADRQQG